VSISAFLNKTYKVAKACHHKLRIKEGDVVALYLDNCLDYPMVVMGVWLSQGIVSLGDFTLTETGLTLQLAQMKPKVVFCSSYNRDKIDNAIRKAALKDVVKVVVINHDKKILGNNCYSLDDLVTEAHHFPSLPLALNNKFDPEAVQVIMWSSGKIIMKNEDTTVSNRDHWQAKGYTDKEQDLPKSPFRKLSTCKSSVFVTDFESPIHR